MRRVDVIQMPTSANRPHGAWNSSRITGTTPIRANVVTSDGHGKGGLEELIVDIDILIAEELDVTHRFGGHLRPVEGCERCGRVSAVPQAGSRASGSPRNPEHIEQTADAG